MISYDHGQSQISLLNSHLTASDLTVWLNSIMLAFFMINFDTHTRRAHTHTYARRADTHAADTHIRRADTYTELSKENVGMCEP